MEIVETWCFQIWVNFEGMSDINWILYYQRHVSFEGNI